jgi:4,5:9,10-diseco-3-hydroxy-5,9,17-trioxoandrosta-1(10),2-diene-4-oate hydrolase
MTGAASAIDREQTGRTIDIGYPLHYHDAGEGEALVLLHGAGPGVSGWSNFHGNLPGFAQRFRTLVVDMPGFGESGKPEFDRPFPQIAADAVARLLDELGIEQAHLLGNSMGAFVAVELTLARPELVGRLALMGFGGVTPNILAPVPSEGGRRAREFGAQPTKPALLAWLHAMVERRDVLTDELIEERWQNSTAPGAVAQLAAVRASMADTEVPRWALLGKVGRPTLLLWGRDDRMVPWEHALLPLRQMPDVELHVFSGCGHWVQVERKAEFERLVTEFLTRREEAIQ